MYEYNLYGHSLKYRSSYISNIVSLRSQLRFGELEVKTINDNLESRRLEVQKSLDQLRRELGL